MNEVVKNVVQMVFDNAGFEKNANTTLETLDKLKEALRFEDAARGISTIGSSIKGLSMESFYNSVDKVQGGFNALEVVAIRVIQNITDKIQGMVSNMLNASTLQPLKDGFEEYQLQMTSVQTITASTGESIAAVNAYLDELNEYADRTIYSFSDMTANIGKFTNAGVSLDKAVAAIQGVSNVAAISGANTNEASRAMYNFAQALSAGSVKLIDWKSIENANMATVGFKEQLIQTAVAMGTLVEKNGEYISTTTDANGKVSEAFTATKMFNDSLSSQWMTTEVLVQTLEQYSTNLDDLNEAEREEYRSKLMSIYGDEQKVDSIIELAKKAAAAAKDVKTFSQLIDTIKESLGSGWTKTWQMIFGDLNEAKHLWTGVNDVISGFVNKVSDSRNALLEAWHKSGYTYNEYGELVKAFYDSEGKLASKLPEDGKIFDQYGKQVKAVVDEDTGEIVPQIIKNGKMLREEMGGRDLFLGGLENTYKTLAGIAGEFSKAWSKFFTGVDNSAISDISLTADKLKELSAAFYDWSDAFNTAWSLHNDLGEADGLLGQLSDTFEFFATSMRNGYDGVTSIFYGLKNAADAFFDSNFFNIGTLDSAVTALSTITGLIKDFGTAFAKHFGADVSGLNKNGLITFFNSIENFIETGAFVKLDLLVGILSSIGQVVEHIIAPFGTFSQLLGIIGGKINTFTNALESMFYNEDAPKFEKMFSNIVTYFNRFLDVLGKTVDFSGFSTFFNNLVEAISSDKVDAFKIIENAFNGLVNILKAFLSIATPVAAAFASIFGDAIFEGLIFIRELSEYFEKFTEKLILNGSAISGLQHFFEGLFSVVKSVGEVLGTVLLSALDGIYKFVTSFLPQGKELGDVLTDTGDKLKEVADSISSLVSGKDGAPKLSELLGNITDKLVQFFKALGSINLLEKLSFLFEKLGEGIKHALGGTEDMTLLDTITEKLKNFMSRLKDIFSDENGALDMVKVLEAGGIGYAIKKLIDMFKELKKGTGDFQGFLGVFKDIKDIFEDLSETIGDSLKTSSIKVIATSILEIAAALFIISMIDPRTLAVSMTVLAGVFDMIDTLLLSLKGFNKSDAAVLGTIAAVIQMLGNSIIMMAGAIAIIGSMEIFDAMQGLGAIIVLLHGLVWTIKELSSIQGDIPKVAGTLIALAIALDLLTIPVVILGKMDFWQLVQGLVAVTLMLTGLVVAIKKISEVGSGAKLGTAALAMIGIAVALDIFAGAVKKLSDLRPDQIGQGLLSLLVTLYAFVGAAAIVSKAKLADDLMALSASLLVFGAAVDLLAIGMKGLGGLSPDEIGQSAKILVGALIGLGVASKIINGKNLLMIGGAIFLVATAISQLAVTLNLAKIIAPICTTISAALSGMSSSLEAFARHAAFESLLELIKDLILFLPMLAVALAKALAAFVVELGNSAVQIVGAVVKIGQAVLQGIAQLFPDLWDIIKVNLTQLGLLIIQEAPLFLAVLNTLFNLLFQFLTSQLPNLFAFLNVLLDEVINFLLTNVPKLVNAAFQLIISFINAFADAVSIYAGPIFDACWRLVTAIASAIIENAPIILEKGKELTRNLIDGLGSLMGDLGNKASALMEHAKEKLAEKVSDTINIGKNFVQGFIDGIAAIPETLGAAAKSLGETALNFLRGSLDENSPSKETEASGKNFVLGFINGINSTDASNSVVRMAKTILNGFKNQFSDMSVMRRQAVVLVNSLAAGLSSGAGRVKAIGSAIMTGLADGIRAGTNAAKSVVTSIISIISSTLTASVGKVKTIGTTLMHGLSSGISGSIGAIRSVCSSITSGIISVFSAGISKVRSIGSNIGHSLSGGISGGIGHLYSIGRNAISGFINGISSLAGAAINLAISIGHRVANALKDALKIHSPSKVTFGYGVYFMEGFINGIRTMISDTDNVISSIATSIVKPLEAMSNSNYSPVIAPVIDGDSMRSTKSALASIGEVFDKSLDFKPIEHHINADVSDYVDWSKKAISDISDKLEYVIDYSKLGESVANSLISSGFYVKMDGGQMVGYLASEIRDVRRMYT